MSELNNFHGIFRSFPRTLIYFPFFYSIIFQDIRGIIFALLIVFNDISNWFLKHNIMQPIYNIFQDKNGKLPILGIGKRPEGANNTNSFIDITKLNKIEKTFGMPSGHSQIAAFAVTFWILYMLDKYDNTLQRNISILFIIIIGLYAMYHRVLFNCHTIQQVIFGGLIGVTIALFSYKFLRNKFINNDK